MARKARVISSINSYTIILKANDGVSFCNHDLIMFLETVSKYSKILDYKFLAYDLNSKFLTFVLYNCNTAIDTVMRKICVSFVNKFNLFNNHKGKVFKNRYLSIPAENIKQVWDMVYDVNNLNSDINSKQNVFTTPFLSVKTLKQYYLTEQNFVNTVINTDKNNKPIVLNRVVANKKFDDNELYSFICNNYNLNPAELKNLPESKLRKIITEIVVATKASARQIARISSLPLRLLWKVTKGVNNE